MASQHDPDPSGSSAFGLHLANPPYRDDICALLNKFPNLRYPDDKRYEDYPFQQPLHGQSQVACLTFRESSLVSHQTVSSPDVLETLLSQAPPAGTRRLFLLEELQPDFVTILGHKLRIPPSVFSRHRRKALWEYDHDAGNTPPLPSLNDPSTHFCFHYWELVYFRDQIKDFYLRCADNERHIAVARFDGRFDNVGIVQRKASFWSRPTAGDGWDAILIVDGPVKEVLLGSGKTYRRAEKPCESFQGGYADFIQYCCLDSARSTPGPPRKSLFDDLLYYFSTHSSHLTITREPASSMLFFQKIMASHLMILGEYYRGIFSHLEWLLSRRETFANLTLDWVEERCSDLHSFNRRCEAYLSDIESVIEQLGIEHEETHPAQHQGQNSITSGEPCRWCQQPTRPSASSTRRDWTSSKLDFLHLQTRFNALKQKSGSLLTAFTNLATIVGNRRALSEARSVRALQYLGLTFLPLSFATGLFSMNGIYLPGSAEGGGRFWIAVVVAVGLVLGVFWLTFVTTQRRGRGWLSRGTGAGSRDLDFAGTLTWMVKPVVKTLRRLEGVRMTRPMVQLLRDIKRLQDRWGILAFFQRRTRRAMGFQAEVRDEEKARPVQSDDGA